MDLSSNEFNNSIFPFLNAATSLTTLFLRYNYMNGGPFPVKGVFLHFWQGLVSKKKKKNKVYLFLFYLWLDWFLYCSFCNLCSDSISDHSYILLDSLSELKNLANLELLDLSGNEYNGSMPGTNYVTCHYCLVLYPY